MDQVDHVGCRRVRLGRKGRPPVADIPIESLVLAAHQTALDHGGGYVGPAQRAALGLVEHLFDGHIHSQIVEALDNGDAPLVPVLMHLVQVGDQVGILPIETVSQDVDFALLDVSAQLGAGDDFYTQSRADFVRLDQTVDRVVIGEAEGLEAGIARLLHGLCRGAQTIGAEGVDVEIGQIVTHGRTLILCTAAWRRLSAGLRFLVNLLKTR